MSDASIEAKEAARKIEVHLQHYVGPELDPIIQSACERYAARVKPERATELEEGYGETPSVVGASTKEEWTTQWDHNHLFVELCDQTGHVIDASFHDMQHANEVRDAHNASLASRGGVQELATQMCEIRQALGMQIATHEQIVEKINTLGGQADTERLDWLGKEGHDYGKDGGGSSIRPCRTWTVRKRGHGGNIRETIDSARGVSIPTKEQQ